MTAGIETLSVVRDGEGYVLGSPRTGAFVAVPEIGGRVVLWLRDGLSVQECARRAGDEVGEPVDVAGFLNGLTEAGLLETEATEDVEPGVSERRRRVGRVLFGPVGLTVQVALSLTAVVLCCTDSRLRPSSADAVATSVPLVSILILLVAGTVLGALHELAHVLAAWATGVPSRVSVGRRMAAVVLQTDLTRLWSVPRRQRIVPLAAGMLLDAALIGAILAVQSVTPVPHALRVVVFANVTAIAYQFLIFLRTDVYALFLVATGCRNLWGVKGALARRAVGRAGDADQALLAATAPREIAWSRAFLLLYLPGAALTAAYFVAFALPAFVRLVGGAVHAIADHGAASPDGAAGVLAVLVTAVALGYVLWGLGRSGYRIVQAMR